MTNIVQSVLNDNPHSHVTKQDELYFRRLIKKQLKQCIKDRHIINLPPSVQVDLIALIWEDSLNDIYNSIKQGKYESEIHELMLRC